MEESLAKTRPNVPSGGVSDAQDALQIERFKQAARELGCDEDEAAFDEKLRVLAKQKQKAAPATERGGPTDKEKKD